VYENAGVEYYQPGHKVYGHPVFKKMMDKYLPNHAELDPDTHWVNGWHIEKKEAYNDWDNDQIKGAMTSTEGYYPMKEDEEERKWGKLTNAEEHGKAASLRKAKAKAEEEAKAAAAAKEEAAAAEGEAAAADGAEVPAEGAAEGAPAEKPADAPAALMQKNQSPWENAAAFAIKNHGHINALN